MGERINTLKELLNQKWIYWEYYPNKPLHITVIRNWQFNAVLKNLEESRLYKAVLKENKNE